MVGHYPFSDPPQWGRGILINRFALPPDFKEKTSRGGGGFWLICIEKEGRVERYRGVINGMKGWPRCHINVYTDTRSVVIQAPWNYSDHRLLEMARFFINAMGGEISATDRIRKLMETELG